MYTAQDRNNTVWPQALSGLVNTVISRIILHCDKQCLIVNIDCFNATVRQSQYNELAGL